MKAPDYIAPPMLEETESPHWPIGRARAERDRIYAALVKGPDSLIAGSGRDSLDALRWRAWTPEDEATWRHLRRGTFNTRTIHRLDRFRLFARYVVALESRFHPPPPPQLLLLAA